MNKGEYAVRVLVNGRPVQEFQKDGQTYIEGRIGTEYAVQIKNNNWNRVMAVITVDGVNVITGKPSIPVSNLEEGYIINGYESLDVTGFRKDLNTVGAFKFCKKSNSYCNEKGLAGNNGVIGVQIFSEKLRSVLWVNAQNTTQNVYYPEIYRSCKSNSNYSGTITSGTITCSHVNIANTTNTVDSNYSTTNKAESPFGVGTTWGKQKQSSVVYVDFECGSLIEEFTLFYASMKGLQKLRVPVKKEVQITHPKAFGAFAEPPKGWLPK